MSFHQIAFVVCFSCMMSQMLMVSGSSLSLEESPAHLCSEGDKRRYELMNSEDLSRSGEIGLNGEISSEGTSTESELYKMVLRTYTNLIKMMNDRPMERNDNSTCLKDKLLRKGYSGDDISFLDCFSCLSKNKCQEDFRSASTDVISSLIESGIIEEENDKGRSGKGEYLDGPEKAEKGIQEQSFLFPQEKIFHKSAVKRAPEENEMNRLGVIETEVERGESELKGIEERLERLGGKQNQINLSLQSTSTSPISLRLSKESYQAAIKNQLESLKNALEHEKKDSKMVLNSMSGSKGLMNMCQKNSFVPLTASSQEIMYGPESQYKGYTVIGSQQYSKGANIGGVPGFGSSAQFASPSALDYYIGGLQPQQTLARSNPSQQQLLVRESGGWPQPPLGYILSREGGSQGGGGNSIQQHQACTGGLCRNGLIGGSMPALLPYQQQQQPPPPPPQQVVAAAPVNGGGMNRVGGDSSGVPSSSSFNGGGPWRGEASPMGSGASACFVVDQPLNHCCGSCSSCQQQAPSSSSSQQMKDSFSLPFRVPLGKDDIRNMENFQMSILSFPSRTIYQPIFGASGNLNGRGGV